MFLKGELKSEGKAHGGVIINASNSKWEDGRLFDRIVNYQGVFQSRFIQSLVLSTYSTAALISHSTCSLLLLGWEGESKAFLYFKAFYVCYYIYISPPDLSYSSFPKITQ